MIHIPGVEGLRVGVLGLGRSGLPVCVALSASGAQVIGWDDKPEVRANALAADITLADMAAPDWVQQLDLLVVSPGIAHLYPAPHPSIAAALDSGVPIDNDIGLFFRAITTSSGRPTVVAITGSNGKSTTAALLHHVLQANGRQSHLAGNIGAGVFSLAPKGGDIVVLELSSYQIDLARTLAPDIAVMTNLTPDHLDRHGGKGGYFAAKRRLFTFPDLACAIIGTDEVEGCFLANRLYGTSTVVIRIIANTPFVRNRMADEARRRQGRTIHIDAGALNIVDDGKLTGQFSVGSISGLTGAHNHANAAIAFAAAQVLGLDEEDIITAMASFPGLAHRCQHVATAGGVTFVNDSKATNVASAAVALRAFADIHWICGGQVKEGGLVSLDTALDNVIAAYVIGEDAAGVAPMLPVDEVLVCTTMQAAVRAAVSRARPGETVLLAPAAASFDQYPGFEARGDDFVRCVKAELSRQGQPAAG